MNITKIFPDTALLAISSHTIIVVGVRSGIFAASGMDSAGTVIRASVHPAAVELMISTKPLTAGL